MTYGYFSFDKTGKISKKVQDVSLGERTVDSNISVKEWKGGLYPYRFLLDQEEGERSTAISGLYPSKGSEGTVPIQISQQTNYPLIPNYIYSVVLHLRITYSLGQITDTFDQKYSYPTKAQWIQLLADRHYLITFRGFNFYQTDNVNILAEVGRGPEIFLSVPLIGVPRSNFIRTTIQADPLSLITARQLPVSRDQYGRSSTFIQEKFSLTGCRMEASDTIIAFCGFPRRKQLRLLSNVDSLNSVDPLSHPQNAENQDMDEPNSASPLWWSFE